MGRFDLDEFVAASCDAAIRESEPWLAIEELLNEALRDRGAIATALPVSKAELVPIYAGPEVTVVKVVWGPGMTFPPHDHLTWACNGLYSGAEHNTLFRLEDDTLHPAGELVIGDGQIGILDADAIHAVRNPDPYRLSAAIHVYGGNFPQLPRSNWIGEPPARVPTDVEVTKQLFADANRPTS